MSDFETTLASPADDIETHTQVDVTGGTLLPSSRAGSSQPRRLIDRQPGLPKPGLAPRRPILPALPRAPVARALPRPVREHKPVDVLLIDLLEQHGPLFENQVILRLAPIGGEVSVTAVRNTIERLWNQGRIAECVGGMMAIPAAKPIGAPAPEPGAEVDRT